MNWFSSEPWALNCIDQYMLGPELLVAPVLKKGAKGRHVCLPEGNWVHLFTGKVYRNGLYQISSRIEDRNIPVFYRQDGEWADFFSTLLKA